MGDPVSYAFIEDKKAPVTTSGRGKRQSVVKVGDTLSGFIVKEIYADKIVLYRGEEKLVVPLSDRDKQRSADSGPPLPRPAGSIGSSVPTSLCLLLFQCLVLFPHLVDRPYCSCTPGQLGQQRGAMPTTNPADARTRALQRMRSLQQQNTGN